MPLVHQCAHDGCVILTMGEFCIEHEPLARDVESEIAEVDGPGPDERRLLDAAERT